MRKSSRRGSLTSVALTALLALTAARASAQAEEAPPGVEVEVEAQVEAPPPPPATTLAAPGTAWGPPAPLLPSAPFPAPMPPPEPVVQERVNWAAIGAGAAAFAGGWLLTWIATVIWYDQTTTCTSTGWFGYTCTHYGPDDAALGWSFAPLIGPWLMLTSPSLQGADLAFPILAGLVQLAGLTTLIVGVLWRERVEVRPRAGAAPQPSLALTLRGTELGLELTF